MEFNRGFIWGLDEKAIRPFGYSNRVVMGPSKNSTKSYTKEQVEETGQGTVTFFIMLVTAITFCATASLDVQDVCPHVTMTSCPIITRENGETVQYIPKPLTPDLDWITQEISKDHEISEDARHYFCTEPACLSNPCQYGGTCEETEIGFSCLCFDGYHGNKCENDTKVLSVKLLGDNISEGPLALTSRLRSNTYFLIHQHQWNMNLSQLACQYLGFEGVFATVSGALYDFIDPPSEVVSVVCPDDVMNITDCWFETRVGGINESETIALICCPVNSCNVSGRPLGLESGALPHSAISESDCYEANLHCGRYGRLNLNGAWIPFNSDEYQWMQVQFESSYIITAVTVQGRHNYNHWVTSFVVSSSLDNITWTDYLNVYTGSVEVFPGNDDRNSYVTHMFIRPIVGRFFRIHPKTFYGRIAMRMELYGFGPVTDVIAALNVEGKPGCRPPLLGEGLGVEDGRIPDSSLTASSFFAADHEPYRGRLNTPEDLGITVGAWVAVKADSNKWVKVELNNETLVTGVISQGRAREASGQMVTSLHISYSRDNTNWIFALEDQCGVRKTYPGNFDGNSYVTTLFPHPVTARFVRFHPVKYRKNPSMRFEVLGINN
ncbi:EGF-like repeat and discoidin I-like domain-containing protein 3 [Lytechinus variegatus]|uniref:EGF-like repeat and discoidin I-like domain-containing protein 3 n=1 Tax=Lytechinus variegatus TaxID=7654 RepID=UPI001BB27CA1|nr:EGF-like repeat and discoidin I-like domain-containing protein 3 [Lytechinus variegatus]